MVIKQMMNYVLSSDGNKFERGEIEAIVESVYEMTEYVFEKLAPRFEQELEFDFIDVSNEWTFATEDSRDNRYEIIFTPVDQYADKFGIGI
ncbi:hypothetical protein [Exiguobacterium sp. RIT341]|uniref:hypothetical protein n=1 Tax=Exiguobacterium sp. RIT341 TaxID=1470592 RepID=UPI000452E0AF|nr:hypothetical protein [Exiguobacterium sp. RIT341]EZP58377.1 hypothetical protein BW42_03059 [Exiguobacterium sp. RIT341]